MSMAASIPGSTLLPLTAYVAPLVCDQQQMAEEVVGPLQDQLIKGCGSHLVTPIPKLFPFPLSHYRSGVGTVLWD